MIVDDDEAIRETVADVLQLAGYEVSLAEDGVQALSLRETDPHPDLILLDLMMPRMDGRAVMANLAADPGLADIPVIAFSAYAGQFDLPAGTKLLRKPVGLDDLLSAVAASAPS
jgi:two-component system response regulator MprA